MDAEGEDLPIADMTRLHGSLGELKRWKKKTPLGRCLFWREECHRPISSHALSKCWLRQLASIDGHVIALRINAEKAGTAPVGMVAERKGVGVVSAFNGFCADHDNSLFREIDTIELEPTSKACALLAYRSTCQNACAKFQIVGASMSLPGFLQSNVPHPFEMHVIREMKGCIDLLARKGVLEQCIDGTVSGTHFCHHVVEFRGTLPFVGTTTSVPTITANGKRLERRLDWVSLTVLPTRDGGIAVFSWEATRAKNANLLIKSLRRFPNERMLDFLLHYLLEHGETFAFSPAWWDSLSEGAQRGLRQRAARSIDTSFNPAPTDIFARQGPLLDCSNVVQRSVS